MHIYKYIHIKRKNGQLNNFDQISYLVNMLTYMG